MVAVPGTIPDTNPEPDITVAIDELLLAQVPPVVLLLRLVA
jgi:hypothetical protein